MARAVRSASASGRVCAETTSWLTLDQHGSALQPTERIRKAEGSHIMTSPRTGVNTSLDERPESGTRQTGVVLEGLEHEAREGRKGLWADPQPMPPWDCLKGSTWGKE